VSKTVIRAHQIKAARALAQMEQRELAARSGVSIPTIKRMEAGDGPVRGTYGNVAAIVAVLESAGIEFLDNDSPGVRLRPGAKPPSKLAKKTPTAPKPARRSAPKKTL
jgi:transcriptional regulator with XRE-family HTH domain